MTNNVLLFVCFLDKNSKNTTTTTTTTTTKQKVNIKILAIAGNCTRDLSRPSRMRYLWTTESTKHIDLSQAI